MKLLPSPTLIAGLLTVLALFPISARTQDASPEQEFSSMLENATLVGTWIPIQPTGPGEARSDRYQILRAIQVDGESWHIVTEMKRQGEVMEMPIPVQVKWAGDTAVLILDDMRSGRETTYSARVMFHRDVYAGSWWNQDGKGGIVSGVVQREADTE